MGLFTKAGHSFEMFCFKNNCKFETFSNPCTFSITVMRKFEQVGYFFLKERVSYSEHFFIQECPFTPKSNAKCKKTVCPSKQHSSNVLIRIFVFSYF